MAKKDFKIDPNTNGFVIENGSLVLIEGIELTQQRLKMKLQILLGEHFRRSDAGVDYDGTVSQKFRDPVKIENMFRAHIMEDEDVIGINSYEQSFNKQNRKFTFKASIQTIFGQTNIGL